MPVHARITTPRRLAALLVGLCLAGAAAAQQQPGTPVPVPMPAPAADPHDATLTRCFGLQRSEPAQAIALAESVLAAAPLPVLTEIKAQSCLGMASGIAGNAERALAAAQRMEALIEAHPQPGAIALRTWSNAGAILHASGQLHRALVMYERAERAALAEESEVAQYKTLINIAEIHAENLDDAEGADALFERAIAIADRIDDSDLTLYVNYARNLVRLGRTQDAQAAYARADDEAKRTGNVLMGHRVAAARANLLHEAERSDSARQLLEDTIVAQRALPDPAGESISLVFLARVQLDAGDTAGALASARQAETLAQADGFLHERIDAIRMQARIHRIAGDTAAALDDTERLHVLEFGAMKRLNLDGLAELQARLQDADKERELERLRLQGEIQTLTLERTRFTRNAVIGTLLALLAAIAAFMLLQRRTNRRLKRLSTLDALTGLINRRAATHRLDSVANSAAPGASARALILLVDIDHFKQVNDRYGHAIGDLILTELSARLKTGCRPDDVVSRWGGEEFLIACGQVTLDQARAVAERLRAAIADTSFPLPDGQRVPVTISIGFAPFPFFPDADGHDAEAWQDAIRLADRALYAAKYNGRNAWVGLWGHTSGALDIDAVLRDPQHAERTRQIAVLSSRAVDWAEQQSSPNT